MDRSNLVNVVHLSLSFFLIFMSYSVAQTFQTSSDYARDGAFAVGVIYLVFCLSNLALSSILTQVFGVRLTLVLASVTYGLFISSNIHYHRWTLYLSSFLLGVGAALLWTGQGVYVTVSTSNHEEVNHLPPSSTRGVVNGLFFGIFQLNQTLGNLLAAYLFYLKFRSGSVFTIMTILAGCGSFSLLFLRPVKIPKKTSRPSILTSLSIIVDRPFLLLIPTMCYGGLTQGFIFAAIPPLIVDRSQKFLMFALYGLVGALSAVFFGKLSDIFPRHRPLIFGAGALAHLILFALFLTVWQPPFDSTRLDVFIPMVICLSIGDAIFMTQLYPALAIFYGTTRPADAFAAMKVFQSGFTAIGFVQQVYLPFTTQIIILMVILFLSLITLFAEQYLVKAPVSREENGDPTEMEMSLNTSPSAL